MSQAALMKSSVKKQNSQFDLFFRRFTALSFDCANFRGQENFVCKVLFTTAVHIYRNHRKLQTVRLFTKSNLP